MQVLTDRNVHKLEINEEIIDVDSCLLNNTMQ